MSLSCGFFNSEDGDRQYFNQDLSNFLEGLIEDGIYEFIDDKMMVSASATPDMHVLIGKGRAWFNGTWTKIDSAYQINQDALLQCKEDVINWIKNNPYSSCYKIATAFGFSVPEMNVILNTLVRNEEVMRTQEHKYYTV